jgi:hypothetical protein
MMAGWQVFLCRIGPCPLDTSALGPPTQAVKRRSDDDGAILVAALGRAAVRLLTDDTVVQLDPVSTDGLPGHFLDALPEAPAAGVRPMWITKSTFDGADDGSPVTPLATTHAAAT